MQYNASFLFAEFIPSSVLREVKLVYKKHDF